MRASYTDYGTDAEHGFVNRGPNSDIATGYGVNGLRGFVPTKEEWLGYETTTVGTAGTSSTD